MALITYAHVPEMTSGYWGNQQPRNKCLSHNQTGTRLQGNNGGSSVGRSPKIQSSATPSDLHILPARSQTFFSFMKVVFSSSSLSEGLSSFSLETGCFFPHLGPISHWTCTFRELFCLLSQITVNYSMNHSSIKKESNSRD